MLHIAALIIAVFLPWPETAAADGLLTSPLFGNSLGGDPFDDGAAAVIPPVARLHSILICYGEMIDGIQPVYVLEDNSTFVGHPHGNNLINEKCTNKSKIVFKEGEVLVHIEGMIQIKWHLISQLTLFTSFGKRPPKRRAGPFGLGGTSDIRFSLTGDIRGIYGRTGDALDAIGFYVNPAVPLSSYQKTNLIGGRAGTDSFDDFELFASKNEKPFKITNMVISHGVYINAIQVTYLTSNGASITLTHGTLNTDNWLGNKYFDVLNFDADEWITKVNISPRFSEAVQCVGYLEIETTNSKGSLRSYGPFGQVYTSNITTIESTIYGLYGSSTDYLAVNTLGFYI